MFPPKLSSHPARALAANHQPNRSASRLRVGDAHLHLLRDVLQQLKQRLLHGCMPPPVLASAGRLCAPGVCVVTRFPFVVGRCGLTLAILERGGVRSALSRCSFCSAMVVRKPSTIPFKLSLIWRSPFSRSCNRRPVRRDAQGKRNQPNLNQLTVVGAATRRRPLSCLSPPPMRALMSQHQLHRTVSDTNI
jgi:hypothetical protein